MKTRCHPNRSRRGKWLAAGLLVGLSLLLSAGSALSQRHQSLLPTGKNIVAHSIQLTTAAPTTTPTTTPKPPYAPPTSTVGSQPPEPEEEPAGLVKRDQGGRVYCGLEFSEVWLEVPAEFVPASADAAEFTCDRVSASGAWQDTGYEVSVNPTSVQILLPIQVVFKAGEASSGTEWLARYRRAQSASWQDAGTDYNASTGRVQTELPTTLFQGGGGFVVGLFEKATATSTWTQTPDVTATGTAEPPSATPEPPSPTTPPGSDKPTPTTQSPPVPSRMPTVTPSVPPPSGSGGAGLIFVIVGGALLAGVGIFLLLRGRGKAPAVAAAELTLIQGQAQPLRLPLRQSIVRIGRDPANNDVVVNDVSVSKHHAEIRLYQGRHFVYDLQSTNGTFVNETPVTQPQILSNNDQITIGSTRWLYRQT